MVVDAIRDIVTYEQKQEKKQFSSKNWTESETYHF